MAPIVAFIILFTASLVLLGAVLFPLWQPLLMAAVLAAALDPWHEHLARRLGARRSLSAAIFTVAVIALLLIPLAALILMALHEAVLGVQYVRQALQEGGIAHLLAALPDQLEAWVQRILAALPQNLTQLSAHAATSGGLVAKWISSAIATGSKLAFDLTIMLVAFYFLLVDGRRFAVWIEEVSPLRGQQTVGLLHDFATVSKSVLGSIVVTAAVQGLLATIGYLIARVPHPVFFGLATFFTAFIPGVGTALVMLPLGGLLILTGHPWYGLFLFLWAFLVVSMADNVLKPFLIQRGGMRLEGAPIFLSLIGGILLFGGVGLILGPLSVTFFLTMLRVGKELAPSSLQPPPTTSP